MRYQSSLLIRDLVFIGNRSSASVARRRFIQAPPRFAIAKLARFHSRSFGQHTNPPFLRRQI
jgi:hypothetical protein